jgi:hypothetical protein
MAQIPITFAGGITEEMLKETAKKMYRATRQGTDPSSGSPQAEEEFIEAVLELVLMIEARRED